MLNICYNTLQAWSGEAENRMILKKVNTPLDADVAVGGGASFLREEATSIYEQRGNAAQQKERLC